MGGQLIQEASKEMEKAHRKYEADFDSGFGLQKRPQNLKVSFLFEKIFWLARSKA